MKISTLIQSTLLGVISLALTCNIFAGDSYIGGSLNETGGGTYLGGIAIGVVVTPSLRDALQEAQKDDLGVDCIGIATEKCMPTISQITLGGILKSGFGQEWGDYGVTAFGTGSIASILVCGTMAGDEATRVAARYVGIGCDSHTPAGLFSTLAAALGVPQSNTLECMSAIEAAGGGAIGFVPSDESDPSYAYIKLDEQSPDWKVFRAGLYPLFGDIHGGSLTDIEVDQIFGKGKAVAKEQTQAFPMLTITPPMHISAGNNQLSNECALGTIRNGGGWLQGSYFENADLSSVYNFDTLHTMYPLTDFDGASTTVSTGPAGDPGNSGMVGETTHTSTMPGFIRGGTILGDPSGFFTPIDFTLTRTTIQMRVWSDSIGTPVLMKVENAVDPLQTASVTQITTLIGWETLQFDFSTVSINTTETFDTLVLTFEQGVALETPTPKTYYWDDVELLP